MLDEVGMLDRLLRFSRCFRTEGPQLPVRQAEVVWQQARENTLGLVVGSFFGMALSVKGRAHDSQPSAPSAEVTMAQACSI
jgi:hypothetical protein